MKRLFLISVLLTIGTGATVSFAQGKILYGSIVVVLGIITLGAYHLAVIYERTVLKGSKVNR